MKMGENKGRPGGRWLDTVAAAAIACANPPLLGTVRVPP